MLTWNVSPFLIDIGPLQIRWYGPLFVAGFLIGMKAMERICRAEGKDPKLMEHLLAWVFGGTMIGARLAHCLFYEPGYYLAAPWEIPMVWHGGLASHGGIVGCVVGLWIFSRRHPSLPVPWILDRLCIYASLSGGLIRLGNLFNSEILGKATTLPVGVVFTRIDQVPRHAAQVYESAWYFLLFLLLYGLYRKYRRNPPPLFLFGLSLVLVFVLRFFVEFVKENQETFELGIGLNVGQLLSVPSILVGLVLMVRALKKRASAATDK